MIPYSIHRLRNGLTVVAHRDRLSAMAAVNMLYRVGARNEDPQHTGFAHLFEHLMFRGTHEVPDFDLPVQRACGENNAFTNNDYTDYYITLPKDNIATALWLESDRMTGLDITPEKLATEKSVVIEEFNQRYLNQPYGEQWLLLRGLVYRTHPYRWPTIGLSPDHVREAGIDLVRDFYDRYYRPSNAILSVAADLEPERVFEMSEYWFGDLPGGEIPTEHLPQEEPQNEARRREVSRSVPAVQITIAFLMGPRGSDEYYRCDLATDILAGGASSRLYRTLVRESGMFSAVNAYITGDMDPGMFVITGQLMQGVAVERGEEALWGALEELRRVPVTDAELDKVRNKFEANMLYGELNVMNKALNLGYYTMLGDTSLINSEIGIYRSVTAEQIMKTSRTLFRREKSCTLIIKPDEKR